MEALDGAQGRAKKKIIGRGGIVIKLKNTEVFSVT